MKDIMKAMILTPTPWGWGVPTLYTGRPGPGKTSVAMAVGQELGLKTMVLSPGEMGEAMFGAVPAVVDGRVDYPAPRWVDDLSYGGLVVVDEVRASPLTVRPALLGLILARRVGGKHLGRGVSIVALSNSAEDSPNGAPLDPAAANRLVHVAWDMPKVSEWQKILHDQVVGSNELVVDAPLNLEEEQTRVREAWALPAAAAVTAVRMTLKKQPSLLHKQPDAGACDGPWPSPRSWTYAALVAASARVHKLSTTWRDRLLEGAIGAEAATAYAVNLDKGEELPDIDGILAGTVTWKPKGDRPDIVIAVVEGIVGAATQETAERAYEVLSDLVDYAPDPIAMGLARLNERQLDIADTKLMRKVAKILGKAVSLK